MCPCPCLKTGSHPNKVNSCHILRNGKPTESRELFLMCLLCSKALSLKHLEDCSICAMSHAKGLVSKQQEKGPLASSNCGAPSDNCGRPRLVQNPICLTRHLTAECRTVTSQELTTLPLSQTLNPSRGDGQERTRGARAELYQKETKRKTKIKRIPLSSAEQSLPLGANYFRLPAGSSVTDCRASPSCLACGQEGYTCCHSERVRGAPRREIIRASRRRLPASPLQWQRTAVVESSEILS